MHSTPQKSSDATRKSVLNAVRKLRGLSGQTLAVTDSRCKDWSMRICDRWSVIHHGTRRSTRKLITDIDAGVICYEQ